MMATSAISLPPPSTMPRPDLRAMPQPGTPQYSREFMGTFPNNALRNHSADCSSNKKVAQLYGGYQPPDTKRRTESGTSSSRLNSFSLSSAPGLGVEVIMPTASPNGTAVRNNSNGGSSTSSSSNSEQLSQTNLYVRGLGSDTTDGDLINLCQKAQVTIGRIISTKAIIDQATGKCKGYGFIDYDSAEAAQMAMKALQEIGVQAQMAKISESHLEEMFSRFGTVISTRILRDPLGQSRGVGFARMESKDKCEAVIQAFNGLKLPDSKEPLTAKFADGGNKKKLQYQNKQFYEHAHESMALPYDLAFQTNGAFLLISIPLGKGQLIKSKNAMKRKQIQKFTNKLTECMHRSLGLKRLGQGFITPLGFPRFALATPAPLNNIQIPTSGYYQIPFSPYLTVLPASLPQSTTPLESTTLMPNLSTQMNHLQFSSQPQYLPPGPQATYIQMPFPPSSLPTLPLEEQILAPAEHTFPLPNILSASTIAAAPNYFTPGVSGTM